MAPTDKARRIGAPKAPRLRVAQWHAPRVAFMADCVRARLQGGVYTGHTQRNIRWLHEIVTAAPVWTVANVHTENLSPPTHRPLNPVELGPPGAWADFQRDPDAAWAERYDAPALDLFPGLLDRAAEFDLVVGFELPPVLKRELQRRGLRYLSIHIHALRMLRDLCLGATTNDPVIAALLAGAAVPQAEVTRQTHRFRALCAFRLVPALAFPPGLPVLVGQTARDSILIEDGRFADWPDREDELAKALKGHEACIFIEHPYRADSRALCEYLRYRHGKSVIATNANGYGVLLSTPSIPAVLTLSSSLGAEAQAFGLPVNFLLGDPRRRLRVEDLDLGVDEPLGHALLSDEFWRAVLLGEAPRAVLEAADPFVLGEHYLRDSLDNWSYQLLRRHLQGAQARKTWMPSGTLAPEREAALIAALGSGQPGVEFSSFDPPLAQGERRRLRGSDPGFAALLGSGFHGVGSWGVWSQPGRSELIVPVRSAPRATLHLTLDVRCFEGLLEQCPVLEVRVGDRLCAAVLFRPLGSRAARVHVHTPASDGPVRFCLMMINASSPLDTGPGDDPRRSAFAITQIEIALETETLTDESQGLAVWGIPSAAGETTAGPTQVTWLE